MVDRPGDAGRVTPVRSAEESRHSELGSSTVALVAKEVGWAVVRC